MKKKNKNSPWECGEGTMHASFSLAVSSTLGFLDSQVEEGHLLNFQLLFISSTTHSQQEGFPGWSRGLPWLVSTGPSPAGGFSLSASNAQDHWLHTPQCNGHVDFASAPTT